MIESVLILGGGSAGLMAALALKIRIPRLVVTVLRSKEIGVIGVGEGSTVGLATFLHEFLKISPRKFFEIAQPTWKLGLRFLWGPRPYFNYTFGQGPEARLPGLSKAAGFYCGDSYENPDVLSALMTQDRAFPRNGANPDFRAPHSYHFENEKFVKFLEGYAQALGVGFREDIVVSVAQNERGIASLKLAGGSDLAADLFVDCSGFASLLLGRTLGEPFISYRASLFCERAVIGGWTRGPADAVIRPYTTCETYNAGWCWQIEHETRINRGYVYAPAFISDADAEAEFRRANPKVEQTRVVPFVCGRYERNWVENVVAIGNSSGFVEPLEATALGAIAMQARLLSSVLYESDLSPGPAQIRAYNRYHARNWDSIRDFLAVHYRFNTRLDTPFWRHCQEHVDLAGAEHFVDIYREMGPSKLWAPIELDAIDSFQTSGYASLLLGQNVRFKTTYSPTPEESRAWIAHRQRMKETAAKGFTVGDALARIRSKEWSWSDYAPQIA